MKVRNSPASKAPPIFRYWELSITFWQGRSDWISYAIHIVGPGTSFAISAFVRLAILLISIEVRSCSTPTTMLDGEKNHLPLSRNLVAFVYGIGTSLVVSSNPWIWAIDLGNSSITSVFPASKMDVGWKRNECESVSESTSNEEAFGRCSIGSTLASAFAYFGLGP